MSTQSQVGKKLKIKKQGNLRLESSNHRMPAAVLRTLSFRSGYSSTNVTRGGAALIQMPGENSTLHCNQMSNTELDQYPGIGFYKPASFAQSAFLVLHSGA